MTIKKETTNHLNSTQKAIKILAVAVEKAAAKISDASNVAIAKIDTAADVASNKIANDALRATDVVANNAAAALKVSNATSGNDHDLLTRLDERLTQIDKNIDLVKRELKEDIKEIKDGTAAKIESNRLQIDKIALMLPALLSDVNELKTGAYPYI